jgi:hypothetical protein
MAGYRHNASSRKRHIKPLGDLKRHIKETARKFQLF